MEQFWDGAARADPFHYVDTRQPRGRPDVPAFWQAGEEVLDRLIADLGFELAGEEDVVEIGCGIGRVTRALAHRVRMVYALDISEEMLAGARRYNRGLSNVRWLHGDGRTLAPLADASCDACISFVVFQHLPDPELTYGYVREIGRVLRPGGWAAFQVSNDPRVHRSPTGLRRLREVVTGRSYRHPAWMGSAVEISRLRTVGADSGLDIERVEHEGSLFCMVLARRTL
jgi:SAM-dependent methyltransferase